MRDFCQQITAHNLDACFTADGLRADHVDRKLLEQMRQAGFTALTFGVESGSNKVLQNLKKGETCEQIESAIAAATDLGFYVTLFFLIGSPGEDEQDIRQSFRLARKYEVERVYFFNLMPLPGTEFYHWAVQRGYYIDEAGGRYSESNFGFSNKAFLRTDVMTIDQLTWWIKQARRVERQIQWRHDLRRDVQRVMGRKIRTNNFFLNALSWYIVSSPGFAAVLRLLGRIINFVAYTARSFCNLEHLPAGVQDDP